jgi:hypothetical protein
MRFVRDQRILHLCEYEFLPYLAFHRAIVQTFLATLIALYFTYLGFEPQHGQLNPRGHFLLI